ncbi:unnamed protein product [Dibothriocephalus latus]|uniref:Uncharacterized protein n=1 Tax=Dibothriocephalus latus TaxID=60516 RepID=A0A3P6QIY5_DIBLA|nr:unnamed protein product [Dibothriocephalus latus]
MQCPRRGASFNLAGIVEHLINKIDLLKSYKQYKGGLIAQFRMEVKPKAKASGCFFLQDIIPASYIQYTCYLQLSSVAITWTHWANGYNFSPLNAYGMPDTYILQNVSAKIIIDFSYWENEDARPNTIQLSDVKLYDIADSGFVGIYENMHWRMARDSEINEFVRKAFNQLKTLFCYQ